MGHVLLLYNLMDSFIVRRADRVIAVSDKIAHELRMSGVKQERLRVIDNGINTERFTIKRITGSLRASLKIGADTQVIGTIGSLTNEKGHECLLNAIPEVSRTFPEAVFILVGEGSERRRLESLSRRLEIQKNVVFAGMRKDIPEILSILDVFVFPSLKEGLPMALLEAQAARVPTIASAVGAIPKVIKDGFTGTLVQPGDPQSLARAVVRALSDRRMACEMAQRGFERVRDNFSSEIMAEKYHQLYSELLSSERRSS
jgi:glycosyltransferase involved in cell wall biosynthesis